MSALSRWQKRMMEEAGITEEDMEEGYSSFLRWKRGCWDEGIMKTPNRWELSTFPPSQESLTEEERADIDTSERLRNIQEGGAVPSPPSLAISQRQPQERGRAGYLQSLFSTAPKKGKEYKTGERS